MLDLAPLATAMAAALRNPGRLDWACVGPAIGLRFAGVRPIGTTGSAAAIEGGMLIGGGLPVDGAMLQAPRQISLLFPGDALRDPDIADRSFAPDQRIVPSRAGRGYAIVFMIGDAECAVLVTEPGAFVSGLTVSEARRAVKPTPAVNPSAA
jgi:hypothetical protein